MADPDNVAQFPTGADLESRAARIADPGIDLKAKHTVACELREMIDTVRDAESARVMPHMIPVLLEILRSGEVAYKKETLEYQFRRVLLEILHRIPSSDAIRPQALTLFTGLLSLMRQENEENGITCCKTINDLVRSFRLLTEELVAEFMKILQEVLRNMPDMVNQVLSDDSAVLDPNVLLPGMRSFKVLSEMALTVVSFCQLNRPIMLQELQNILSLSFEMISLQSPAQKRAREDVEAMGQIWAGVSPGIKNQHAYADFIATQIKITSYLAFVWRSLGEHFDPYGEPLLVTCVRILQDCPPNSITARKELIVVIRHLIGTNYRRGLSGQIDKLLDDRVLLGSGVGSQETLRPAAYGAIADLIHHLRGELTPAQLANISQVYSRLMHNPSLAINIHALCAKMIFSVSEAVLAKDTPQGAASVLTAVFESCVDKLDAMTVVQTEVTARLERVKNGEVERMNSFLIEKERPVAGAVYAIERGEEVLQESRLLFRTLLHGLRACLQHLKKCEAPAPDGTLILRLFESCIRCLVLSESDPREAADPIEVFCQLLVEVNPHVFQHVWTEKFEFYFQFAQKRPNFLAICQSLFGREPTSSPLVAIVLRFLIDRLPLLGEYDDATAVAAIRLFKLAFGAVSLYPVANEPILASHLGRLIMDCFPLAAKASQPMNYFHLLRALFRAIGGGGGRFELLYMEVLPLLPEMLESLNRQLLASEGMMREMIVELCLTVPLRLTHLLPHLSYLMRPLVLALRGNLELVSQGLRTLELCIDNLTPDFLDPTLSPVLRDLMEALHHHLKPLPANHHHAHTTIRILGKLGGRNRRLLHNEPSFKYHHHSEPATLSLSFGGRIQEILLEPVSRLASRTLRRSDSPYRAYAYNYLESCATILLNQQSPLGRNREDVFVRALEGLFDAVHILEMQEQAEKYIRELSRYILTVETRTGVGKDPSSRRYPSPLLAAYLDSLPHALARESVTESEKAQELLSQVVKDLVTMDRDGGVTSQDIVLTLHQIASRFSALCLDEPWVRKSAGCNGIKIMTCTPDLGVKWINDREVDLVRTLLHVLKDLPSEPPRNVEEIIDVLTRVLRVSNGDLHAMQDPSLHVKHRLSHLIGIFFTELSSSNSVVRQAAQTCIELLADLSGRPAVELLAPHRERVLTNIYTKPLRALPYTNQIGMIEAVRYCLSLDPPLPELNEELLRLLHETLALADAEETAANFSGRSSPRQAALEVIRMRVACIKLLTASMPLTDFFSKHPQTRQRVTGVYFKSLYSPSQEVKDVAHEGLRMVLTHQSRLPRELLQTGLRPILMNLADPKRLSVPGLEGLGRLLELLTSYFKVEIGHKLLDHFRTVADPQMLQMSSRMPVSDNEGITKLVRLANIFHLLPSAANIFLENLVAAIVQTEAQMHFFGRSPFSEPLAKFLDRYPAESVELLLRHLRSTRHLRTFRSVLQARLAPNLEQELVSSTPAILSTCIRSNDRALLLPGLSLCADLASIVPTWIVEHGYVVDALLPIWRTEQIQSGLTATTLSDVIERNSSIMSVFLKALELSPRIDILFEIVAIYTRNLAMDLTRLTQFLYGHVAMNDSLPFRRNVLTRFLTWFDDHAVPWVQKTYFIRFIVTPMLLVHASRAAGVAQLVDSGIIAHMHRRLWHPMSDNTAFAEADDMFKIELLHLTTVMVHHYSELLVDVQKDIIKSAWYYIRSDDAVVKQTAYLLAARFFESFETPEKFILRAWTGLLRPPHSEGRTLVRQALDILAPVLPRTQKEGEIGYPAWAKTTRRLLAEEGTGLSQIIIIYQLIVRQPLLFYPCRALFIPHMVNTLPKLGLSGSASPETRLLTIEILQVLFDWEQKASAEAHASAASGEPVNVWLTPLAFCEAMVSYLVRLATTHHDVQTRSTVTHRSLELLRVMIGPKGWKDVTVKLHYFSRALEQNDMNNDATLGQALSAAKVLQVVSADKPDAWFLANSAILQKLVQKGLVTDDSALHDSLHPVFDRLLRLFPLPKEEDEQQGDTGEFHSFIYTAINDGLRNSNALHGTLLMLKSVVDVVPERIESFNVLLVKLLGKLTKEHIASSPTAQGFENGVRVLTAILEISQITVTFLADQRRWLISALGALIDKSKSPILCRYILDIARDWALCKRDTYPTMKEKAGLLQRMVTYELRGDVLFNGYLELILDIYTEPTLRRSDLTARLEQPFLLGCRARDTALRERFIDLLDASIPRTLFSRVSYILGVQSWESLADHNWIFLALHLLLGSIDGKMPLIANRKTLIGSTSLSSYSTDTRCTEDVIRPMQHLLYLDPETAHETWIAMFPAIWTCLSRREQADVTHHMVNLLSKDYHVKQVEMRPNVIQSLLTGVLACSPPMTLPAHLIKYLAKNYGAWFVGLEIMQESLDQVRDDDTSVRDSVYDSLAEVYAELAEDDMFYGLWRRRCLYQESNIAIAFEQNGMWDQASSTYENAMNKVRTGILPFSEPEYCLWEDHWILAAEKLQQWDALYDLARNEGNQELMLESAWRIKDWAENREALEEQINLLPEVATPRRRVFEAFVAAMKLSTAQDKTEFTKNLEDAMQLSLRKWISLPPHLSSAHIPLLQHFQQFVELQEAVQIFASLSTTNAQNLEKKSSDLKMVLQAWRERLPSACDDISIWSDLVAWRQNVFNAINKSYIPLIQAPAPGGGPATSNTNTFGYRGYHETAWIINRFAQIARRHGLLDACFTSLSKIYTLPNIEISEAFLKLREQARCHYQKPNDLLAGLDVINNTNLMYFSNAQKAEFYTLKGMFHAKLGRNDEANAAFGQAVQLDLTQAKGWAEWGKYSDRMFQEYPADMSHAANAVSCYLQAAGQYKSGRSRPLLTRVLWLLSVDDGNLTISRAFDTYKGDAAFWYWISLIPQLCLSISQREVKQARYLLLNIAKLYPQALFFQLRTTREDMSYVRKQAAAAAAVARAQPVSASGAIDTAKTSDLGEGPAVEADKKETTLTADAVAPLITSSSSAHVPAGMPSGASFTSQGPSEPATSYPVRQSWEYVDEVVQILKTAFPLLILTMETMVDQINQRFKATPEEEIYRLTCMLLQDAVQTYVFRIGKANDDGSLSVQTLSNITRMATNLTGPARKDYEEDFIKSKPSHAEYIRRLQHWRDRYEKHLDSRPRIQPLDLLSHYLTEFQYGKFDEIEVPGQYTEDKDNNQNFVRIRKFGPKFENCRSHGYCWRRFTVHGHDGSKTSFAVQLPSGRHCRREERVMQLFRTFNQALTRKKESRKRNLNFHLPAAISCSPSLRLVQNDSSYVTLGDIYDQHCERIGVTREDPILVAGEKTKSVVREFQQSSGRSPKQTEYFSLKKEIMDEVVAKIVPEDVLTHYMICTMDGPGELWRMRKQFALQLASVSFMTYVLCFTSRLPSRFHWSRATGQLAMTELLPGVANHAPVFASMDDVPFRFTPNLQHFLGPIGTEGILTSGIMSIARCLTEPEFDLERQLCLFARDEVMTWLHGRGKPWTFDMSFRTNVANNIEGVVKRAETMACKLEREQVANNPNVPATVPVVHTVTGLISSATNPLLLMRMTEFYHPWF